jgi:hypothetical protein
VISRIVDRFHQRLLGAGAPQGKLIRSASWSSPEPLPPGSAGRRAINDNPRDPRQRQGLGRVYPDRGQVLTVEIDDATEKVLSVRRFDGLR